MGDDYGSQLADGPVAFSASELTAVPEPDSLVLLGTGIVLFLAFYLIERITVKLSSKKGKS